MPWVMGGGRGGGGRSRRPPRPPPPRRGALLLRRPRCGDGASAAGASGTPRRRGAGVRGGVGGVHGGTSPPRPPARAWGVSESLTVTPGHVGGMRPGAGAGAGPGDWTACGMTHVVRVMSRYVAARSAALRGVTRRSAALRGVPRRSGSREYHVPCKSFVSPSRGAAQVAAAGGGGGGGGGMRA